MKLWKARRATYKAARVMGDAQAVKSGRVAQRIVNRAVGRTAGKALRRLWR